MIANLPDLLTVANPDAYFFPGQLYTDPALLPLERERIFRRTWLYAGDAAQLAPGQVWVKEVAGLSLLIVRDKDHQLRAFHNVCPHRASPLCTQSGIQSLKHIICPYHAWVYGLDGKLIGAPSHDRFPDTFDTPDFPLVPVAIALWDNFIFVCLSKPPCDLTDFLGDIPTALQGYRQPTTELVIQKQYTVACNWKNYHDNTLCDYHVAIAHRQTLNKVQGPIRHYEHSFGDYVNCLYTPTTPRWRADNIVLEHLSDRNRYGFLTFGMFPNLHLLAFPNGVLAWIQIEPNGVESCCVNLEVFAIPGFSTPTEILLKDFEDFMQEDMDLTEGVQKGYASGVYQSGMANHLEDRIIHQQKLIRQHLLNA
ncbi:MAG TPA: aromatic ring-hydroxylating dioxygenase subunit alpha [Candidatus Obscuribacterales bacterium]